MSIITKPRRPKPASNGRPIPRMTVREYFELPTDQPFETLLIYGKLITMGNPTPKHNDFLHDLGEMLRRWVRYNNLGRIFFDNDLILDEDRALVYAPDLMFLTKDHNDQCRDEKVFGPVDLAVEILSPTERPYLQRRKFTDYERYGIPWYWIIDPNAEPATLEEHQLVNGRYECRTEIAGEEWFEPALFPGLVFRLPELLNGDLKAAVKGKAKKLM